MEQSVFERAGIRLKNLRIALGYPTRPAFEQHLGMSKGRLGNVEQLNNRLNEDDFYLIGKRYPWALEYIAVGGDLVIPDDVEAPASAMGEGINRIKTSAAAPFAHTAKRANNPSIDPAELMKVITTDPDAKAAFQQMMVEILQQGLNSDGN